jgi:hypothetical protein
MQSVLGVVTTVCCFGAAYAAHAIFPVPTAVPSLNVPTYTAQPAYQVKPPAPPAPAYQVNPQPAPSSKYNPADLQYNTESQLDDEQQRKNLSRPQPSRRFAKVVV